MPREGWLERQRRNTAKNVYEWPEWMRREAGIPNPEKNAINDLRTELARVRAALRLLTDAADGEGCAGSTIQVAVDKARAALEGRG